MATADTGTSDVMGAVKGGGGATSELFQQRGKVIDQIGAQTADMKQHTEALTTDIDKATAKAADITKNSGVLTPPKLEAAPQPKPTDLMTQFGSPAMFLAALGSRMTRTPLTSSLNASAAVLNAYKAKDYAKAQQEYETWKTNTDNAMKLHTFQMEAYREALAGADRDQNAAVAKYKAYASAFQDDTALRMVQIGGIDAAIRDVRAKEEMGVRLAAVRPQLEQEHERMQALGAVTKARDSLLTQQKLNDPVAVAKATEELQVAMQHMRDVNNTFNPSFAATETRTAANPMGAFVAEYRASHNGEDPPAEDLAKFKRTSAVGTEGKLAPEALKTMAEQYLAGDKSAMQNLGRGAQGSANLVALRGEVARQMAERNMSGADMATKMAEFEGLKAGERSLGTRTANIGMAVNEAKQIIPIAEEASRAVDRTKYPTLNSILLAAEKGSGGEAVARFAAANNTLINVYSRAVSGGAPTVSDKEHAREIISTAYSQGQYEAVIDLLKRELAAASASPGAVREEFREYNRPRETGKAATDSIPAAARSALKEGQVTTFGNGQKWTLKNGQPEQVQ